MMHRLAATLACLIPVIASSAGMRVIDVPGFRVEVPDGEVAKDSKSLDEGFLVLTSRDAGAFAPLVEKLDADQLTSLAIVQVSWEAFDGNGEERWQKIVDLKLKQLPNPDAHRLAVVRLENNRVVFLLGDNSLPAGFGIIPCGPQFTVTILTAFTKSPAQSLAAIRRITESVECKAGGRQIRDPEVPVRLPRTFGRMSKGPGQIYKSTDGEMLLAMYGPGNLLDSQNGLEDFLKRTALGLMEVPATDISLEPVPRESLRGREMSLYRVRVPGKMNGIFEGARYCAKQNVTLFHMWHGGSGKPADAVERMSWLGCPGEASTPVRSYRAVFKEACDRGNDFACRSLRDDPG